MRCPAARLVVTAAKNWGSTFILGAGLGMAAFAWVHLTAADPYASVNMNRYAATVRNAIEAARVTRLWLDIGYGAQVGLAVGIIAAVGPISWAQRATDRLAPFGLVALTWVLVGSWLQRLLLNLFKFRLGGANWNAIISGGVFLLAGGVVALMLARSIVNSQEATSEDAARDAAFETA